jgi:uncharacterized protein with HEPN domain
MQLEVGKLLWDALQACNLILTFTAGKSFENYQDDVLLRSAVERQFEIVGEALNQMSKIDLVTADAIPQFRQIVSFRNLLIHGYSTVDDRVVWTVLVEHLPPLKLVLAALVEQSPP